jgi:hypothetical protein
MRWLSAVMSAVILINTVGCTASRRATLETELTRTSSRIEKDPGQAIEGYIDTRGETHRMLGRVRTIPGDSLEFTVRKAVMFELEKQAPDVRFTVPSDSVSALLVQRVDGVRTAVGVVVLAGAAVIIAAAAAFGDFCPLCGFGQ